MSSKRKSRSVRRSEKRLRAQPPLRGGVNAAPIRLPFLDDSLFASEPVQLPWRTLGEWFGHRFGVEGLELLARGDVLAGHGVAVNAQYPYTPGERLWVFRPILDEPSEPIVLPVVSETERYVVVDKPHGMATAPKGSHVAQTVLVAARRQFNNDLLVPAHRLDLETAGLLLLVKEPQWRGSYQKLFERRAITKKYRAVAQLVRDAQLGDQWHSDLALRKTEGEMRVEVLDTCANDICSEYSAEESSVFDGQYYGERRRRSVRTAEHVVTDIQLSRILKRDDAQIGVYTLYPHTGFTHQLRVAMWQLGVPICGDPAYPEVMSMQASAERAYPLQLLAASLSFTDPVTGEDTQLESAQKLELEVQGC